MTQMKTSLKIETKLEAFYTDGKIKISKDGKYMFCGCGQKVQMLNIVTSNLASSFSKEEEVVTDFILSPDDQYLIIATQNMLIRQWNWRENKLLRSWRAIHRTPVMTMAFDTTSTLLATGSTDFTIKVWDIVQEHCTHDFTGHRGVICALEFNPDKSRLQLVSASDDNMVRIWDLVSGTCILEHQAHYSTVTSLVFTPDGSTMYSTGRDSVVVIWDMVKLQAVKTVPVFERIESLILLNENINTSLIKLDDTKQHYLVAGNKGTLSIYEHNNGKCVYSKKLVTVDNNKCEDEQVITQCIYHSVLKQFILVTYDHNVLVVNEEDLSIQKQFSGYMDEVLDLQFIGQQDSHIIVVTNSEKIKIYEKGSWKCQILIGHTDIVLNVSVHKATGTIASSAKDNTVRIWKFEESTGLVSCVAIATGHLQAVGAVCLTNLGAKFVISGSEDHTLKKWCLPSEFKMDTILNLTASVTDIAHEKDINCVDISPNDKFIATCSLDKTAKIWQESDFKLLGVMRGHRRGIWCIQFSPVDQCVLTGSADSTIKIWSLQDFSCVKTFEGHTASVLTSVFISNGMQILSSGADGVLKIWTIKSNECIKSYDDHNGKIWALTCNSKQDVIVTGAADSTVIFWKDVTEEERKEDLKKQAELILQEQTLSNLIQQKKYLKALSLAITLEKPFRVLTIIKTILKENQGTEELESTLSKLQTYQVDSILRFAVTWNTNSKHCQEAQLIVSIVLKSFSPNQLLEFPNIQSTLEGLVPYTERHFKRMNRLLQQSMFVDYTWSCMGRVADISTGSLQDSVSMSEETDFVISRKGSAISGAKESDNNDSVNKNTDEDSDMETSSDNDTQAVDNAETSLNKSHHNKSDTESSSSSEESEPDEVKRKVAAVKSCLPKEVTTKQIVHNTHSSKKLKLDTPKQSMMRKSSSRTKLIKKPIKAH